MCTNFPKKLDSLLLGSDTDRPPPTAREESDRKFLRDPARKAGQPRLETGLVRYMSSLS